MNTRTDLINYIIKEMDYKTYLEIGIYEGENFSKVQCENKTGVDPNCGVDGVIRQFSDDFFKENNKLYDIIFIDGDHNYEQVNKDVQNALKSITKNGIVVMHDTCPPTLAHAGRHREGEWCGDAYKVAIQANNSPDNQVITWNKDFGVTLIVNSTTLPQSFGYTYSDLVANNFEAVNVQPLGVIQEFITSLKIAETEIKIDAELDRIELEQEEVEEIDLKAYYKLCLPENRIGRKSDKTLIQELKDAGFEV